MRARTCQLGQTLVCIVASLLILSSVYTYRERDAKATFEISPNRNNWWIRAPGATLAQKCETGDRNFSKHISASKSQQGEDAYLWNYFGDLCGGSYIELGALDGMTYSNSHVFKELNWSGVLIEASPINAAKLTKNRPNDICVNTAVCETSGIVHYLEGGAVGGIWEFMAETYRNRWHKGKSIADTTEVPCEPLAAIVKMHTNQTFFILKSRC